jgi:exodeoxyribonuclease V alpha subunit
MTETVENKLDMFLLEFLREKYEMEKDNPLWRGTALLLQRLWQGSVCVSIEDLKKDIDGFSDASLQSAAVARNGETRPLIFDGNNLYIQRYHVYQTRIINKIDALIKNKKFHIITGGPGTGKTFSLAGILQEKPDGKVLLAAPTGKAAARMKESLENAAKGIGGSQAEKISGLEPKTIHRLLGYRRLSVNFRHDADNPLDASLIAIDECSMVDLPLMAKLLDAVPETCDLYLLGDKNQLASVEAGTVFADICEKYKNNSEVYTELTENHRAKDAPGIDRLSKQILRGEVTSFDNENVHYITGKSVDDFAGAYQPLFAARTAPDALQMLANYQILCATRKGRQGAEQINRRFEKIARNENAVFTPIIITENDYGQSLFNGDTGVRDRDTAYFSSGKNGIRTIPVLTLPEYELAFAITIHKSQGSEYDRVAVAYPAHEKEADDPGIFTKELLYTAITRAKREVLIFGDAGLLKNSLKNKIIRASGINE